MTKAQPNIHIPSNYTPQMTMVIPGRRSLGETFTKVEVGVRNDRIVIHTEATEAPPSGNIMVAVHGEDAKYAEELLQMMTENQRASLAGGGITDEDRKEINRKWMDHIEQKLRHLRGITQIGATGHLSQRQRVHQNPATRPAHS